MSAGGTRPAKLYPPTRLSHDQAVCIEPTSHYSDNSRTANWQLLVQVAPGVWLHKDVCDDCAELAWPTRTGF